MTHYQNKKIDIILPWRIGDAILNIPMLVCLKQLNIAFFTETININWGYTAKIKYGLTNSFKKIIKFDHELTFMDINKFKNFLPADLISFLQDKYNLGQYSISLFGILLELGYTSEQIINSFDFNSINKAFF